MMTSSNSRACPPDQATYSKASAASPSRRAGSLPCGTAEQHVQAVQHIPTKDSFLAGEVCLKLARILLTIQPAPDQEADRHRHATRDSTDHAGHPEGGVEVERVSVRPGQGRR